jgi:hypothetical protein
MFGRLNMLAAWSLLGWAYACKLVWLGVSYAHSSVRKLLGHMCAQQCAQVAMSYVTMDQ